MHPNDGRVVSNFILQALKGEDISIYGDGSQTRSFCYVEDLISVIIKMMESDHCGPGPINIGNPKEITIVDLANLIIDLIGSSSKIVNHPLPYDDPVRRRPDISNAKELFDWEPSTSLEIGLKATITFFEEVLKNDEGCL
jgi:UDP-glucuronate decarboxylase